jgi:aspartate kinase
MSIKVFKFGGASIKDADGFRQVGRILNLHQADKLVIVVSALGKTTNAMESVVNSFFTKDSRTITLLKDIQKQHLTIVQDLFDESQSFTIHVEEEIRKFFQHLIDQLDSFVDEEYDLVYDQIVSYGELLSSKILSYYLISIGLGNEWVDVRKFIRTDDTFRDAKILWDFTQSNVDDWLMPVINNQSRVVTQGFLGCTKDGLTTTLGREGSDYTAAILTYCLDADSMHIWKDVPGVLTGDPLQFKDVSLLPRLSYKEAIEMTYYGAKVIHPKTIKPIQNKQIPLYVRPFMDPASTGTLISDEKELTYPPIVVIEPQQALLHISTNDFSFVAEHHLSHIFTLLAKYRLKVNMMRNTAISFSVCVGQIDERIKNFEAALGTDFKMVEDRGLELITILHYNEDLLKDIKHDKLILFEERLPEIVQLVVKNIPKMTRIENDLSE